MKEKMKLRGMLLASLASSLWAISGISGEILFKKYNFSSDWLVSTRTLILLFMTILGVVFIATKGKISSLSVSPEALLLGLISAIMIAFYSIYPKRLLKKYGSITVVGWGMIVGSIISNIVHPIWKIQGDVNSKSIIQVAIVVILGTSIAYLIYIASLNYISSSLAGILTAFEPVLAAVLSVVIFGLRFSFVELIGFILVFVSIFILEKRL